MAAAKGSAKRERKTRDGQEEKQIHKKSNWRKGHEYAEIRNKSVTGREKVRNGTIRKIGTQIEIATKPKPVEEKNTQKKKKDKEKLLNRRMQKQKIPSVYYRSWNLGLWLRQT